MQGSSYIANVGLYHGERGLLCWFHNCVGVACSVWRATCACCTNRNRVPPLAQAVAPGEVVLAIRDMLAAADLPLGLEQGRLLEQSLGLQQQLKATQAALNHQQAVPS